jgi:hypothetical protein
MFAKGKAEEDPAAGKGQREPDHSAQVSLQVRKVWGAVTPYRQGGSIRVTLPKELGRRFGIEFREPQEAARPTLLLFESDAGILLMPLGLMGNWPELQRLTRTPPPE